MTFARIALVLALPFFAGCRSLPVEEPKDIAFALQETYAAAERHKAAGNAAEAANLAELIMRVDPEFPGARSLRESLPDVDYLFGHDLLGSNYAKRVEVERSTAEKALLYLPDRLLDFLDIFSFDVHVGFGLFQNVFLTRGFQIGGGFRGTGGIGWHDHRSFGALGQSEAGFNAAIYNSTLYVGVLSGTNGVVTGSGASLDGLARPSNSIYQEMRDYWAIGANLTLILFGVDFAFHPVEMADAILGFTTYDILNDDLAHTGGLEYTRQERRFMRTLANAEDDPETLDAYRKGKAGGATSGMPSSSLAVPAP